MSVDVYLGDKKYFGVLEENSDYNPIELNEAQMYLESFQEGQAYRDAMNITNDRGIIELSTPFVVEVIASRQQDAVELGKNLLSGAADAGFGAYVIEGMKDIKKSNTRVPALGVAANFETATVRSEVQALKGISKFVGPVALMQTLSDLKKDFEKYEGEDRFKAAKLTLAGAGTSAAIGGGAALLTSSFWIPLGVGAFAGWATSKIADKYKEDLQEKQSE